MNNKIATFFLFLAILAFPLNNLANTSRQKEKNKGKTKEKKGTTIESKEKSKTIAVVKTDTIKSVSAVEPLPIDTLKVAKELKFKFYKKNAHASYYSNKFQGRRAASGARFDNNKYTAAHKKLPFGTKIKVTNEANGRSVVVEVTDRGPFSKVREIDLTKKAFMELVDNKNTGSVIVKLEVEDK